MREITHDGDLDHLREFYRHFGHVEAAPVSVLYEDWALGVAEDTEILDRLLTLPAEKRQPNLLFAAARLHGTPLKPWEDARPQIITHWEDIAATMRQRRTQTNEPGRSAVLNLALARIEGPVALIEVGASAGLLLYPDCWEIRYGTGQGPITLEPTGPVRAEVDLDCALEGIEPPSSLPEVAWRAGVDLNPLDLRRDDDREWLETLVWPGMEYRLDRIHAGALLVAAQPPSLVRGDLNGMLPQLLSQVPHGATPVVFHSAVLAYLPLEDRESFARQVRASEARWISNEGVNVLPEIAQRLPGGDDDATDFVLALDGEPIARTGPHGQYARAL
ncbi:DUF2332 domain-containing protein [Nesterenkonia sp. HG001]|uniref:DUF2332 domain-containing protein n=1 Tax=Nesterenkonia sp. HG001 TaxID=2983207 RepID=UPI002AC5DB5F|nr:DUF2332 domain-containing protein [Nesterenkonia sp. HG001]MDZ5078967.1 DUF2332 domain-containing protein [Nesterenkonia sp. HG001]